MVTMTRSKVKSRSHHDIAPLQPPNQCPYRVSTSYTLEFPRYGPDKILSVKVTMARSKVKSRSHHDLAHLHSLTNISTKYQLRLMAFEILPGQEFIGQCHYSKVKSRSHHDIAHLHPLTNVPTKYQLPTPYSFRDVALIRFYRSRSLQKGQRSNEDHTMMLHTYNPQQMSLPSIDFLHLTVSEI